MQDSFYSIPRPCYVYLLLLNVDDEDPYYFVGKSFATSLSKVYSRHLHAGFATTKDIFAVDSRPSLYVLQDRPLTGDESYKYIVAYVRYFAENKLGETLNYEETEWQARHMKPETEKIYQEISKESLPDLLRRTYVMRPVDADRKREVTLAAQERKKIVQLNVSVCEDDKTRFAAYCRKMGANRREAFALLLEAATTKTTEMLRQLMIKKEEKIETQAQEIRKLEHKLALATEQEIPKKELWASRMYPIMLEGVKRYVSLLFPEKNVVHPIQSRPYKGYTKPLLPHEEYVYPEEEGFYVFQLQAVLWGRNKAAFYIGVDAKGRHYRMRYYDKNWFVGTPPRGSGYEEEGSVWLCGVVRAMDGGMDLVAALPLPHIKVIFPVHSDEEDHLAEQKKPALDDRIAKIEGR